MVVNWRTGHEAGSSFFEVQRSANRLEFETLAKVNSKGTGQGANYSWTDSNPLAGENFYRLKIVEPNQTSYSKIISAVLTKRNFGIGKMYSTPLGLKIELLTDRNRPATVTIFAMSGAVSFTKTYTATAPVLNISVPILNLAPGNYILRVDSQGTGDSRIFNKLR